MTDKKSQTKKIVIGALVALLVLFAAWSLMSKQEVAPAADVPAVSEVAPSEMPDVPPPPPPPESLEPEAPLPEAPLPESVEPAAPQPSEVPELPQEAPAQ